MYGSKCPQNSTFVLHCSNRKKLQCNDKSLTPVTSKVIYEHRNVVDAKCIKFCPVDYDCQINNIIPQQLLQTNFPQNTAKLFFTLHKMTEIYKFKCNQYLTCTPNTDLFISSGNHWICFV